MSAQVATERSSYIQGQIARLSSELVRLDEQRHASLGTILEGNDKTFSDISSGLADEAGKLCAAASAASLKQARRRAWPAALGLSAPWGSGRPRILCWLGLLALAWVAATYSGLGSALGIPVLVAGYVALVAWGRGRAALRESQVERDAIEAFRALRPTMVAFDSEQSADPQYPYRGTLAPIGEQEGLSTCFQVDARKLGEQFGATFLAMREPAGKVCVMARFAVDGFESQVFPFNDLTTNDPRWETWKRLATTLSGSAARYAGKIRAHAREVAALDAVKSRIELARQRIETLSGLERAWSDVALPDETLDGILRLVDTFKSGRPVKGILLFGPPGTGKTLVARKLARHSGCHFVSVGISDLKGAHIGHTGPRVRETWEQCRKNAPTILFVDECEGVFASRGSADSDAFSDELVQTFLSEWDGFNQTSGQVFVVGATNRHDLIDNAIMSRFTETFEIGAPDVEGRRRILANEVARSHLAFEPTDEMVRETAGMTGRDIATLVSKIVASHIHGEVTQEVFAREVRKLRGKQSTSVSRLDWGDLVLPEATLADFRSLGRELVHAEDLRGLGVEVPRGILLHGPPGTGKTQVARVLASESGLAFIAASSSDLKAGYTGQSGNKVKQLFEKARGQSPCILFLDEIDAVARTRGEGDSFTNEIVAQLLQELDGVASKKGQVFLLAASNHPQGIDPALMSRFERKIEIGLPDEAARAAILALQMEGKPVGFDAPGTCARLATRTRGMSGRDLQSLVTSATRKALQRAMQDNGDPRNLVLQVEDLENSLDQHIPTGAN